MSEELKACPLCGGKAESYYDRDYMGEIDEWHGCDRCGLYVATIAVWNRRTPGPATQVVIDKLTVTQTGESDLSGCEIDAFKAEYGQ